MSKGGILLFKNDFADIVEMNPRRAPVGVTAMVAAKFVKEIVAVMLQDGRER